MKPACVRQILPNVNDFKVFWKDKGPFACALTAKEYPPVLLEPEEWIFGSDPISVIRELMNFTRDKMAFVRAPFNADNTSVLRPGEMIPWKITHFPEPWSYVACDAFMPEGYLTAAVAEKMAHLGLADDANGVETAFFALVEEHLDAMGYTLLKPFGKSKFAAIRAYLDEWSADEADAGLI